MQAQSFEMPISIGFQAIAHIKALHALALLSGTAYFKFMQSHINGYRHFSA